GAFAFCVATNGQPQRQIWIMSAERELGLRTQFKLVKDVIQFGFGEAVDFKCADENLVTAGLLGNPRQNRLAKHRGHFLRNTGKPNESFTVADGNAKTRRGAERVRNDD